MEKNEKRIINITKKLNMSFKINSLYLSDGYKVGHKAMLAPGTTKLYGTWIWGQTLPLVNACSYTNVVI